MELSAMMISTVLAPVLIVFGLSHILYAGVWTKLFKGWAKDHTTLLPVMLMLLIFGLIVVNLYNVWTWNVWLLVTLMGWGMLLKGALYFLLPGSWLTGTIKSFTHEGWMYASGLIAVIIGGVLCYFTFWI
jgi:hypothetical protein